MVNKFEGNLLAEKSDKFAIIVSRFNDFIGSRLLAGAQDTFLRHGVDSANIDVYYVTGAFEIPLIAKKIAKNYQAVITLGAIIKGETGHYDFVAAELSKGIAQVSLECGTPIIFGVLTCDNLEQAIERAGAKSGNKGADAAKSAIEMANLIKKL